MLNFSSFLILKYNFMFRKKENVDILVLSLCDGGYLDVVSLILIDFISGIENVDN